MAFVSATIFGGTFYLNSSLSSECEDLQEEIKKLHRTMEGFRADSSNFFSLERDSALALKDLQKMADLEKSQRVFWNDVLNENENIFINWKKRSPEGVNADIIKLFTSLRNQCTSSFVVMPVKSSQNVGFGLGENTPKAEYGFGFSSYDGFWPSFTEEEAKLLGIQGKIVKELIGYLCSSSEEKHPIELFEVKREPVGKVDKKNIRESELNLTRSSPFLLRSKLNVSSYAFELKFKSHTSHARKFLNQLRPPFLLRNLVVKRISEEPNQGSGFTPTLPGFEMDAPSDPDTPLPIVTDVISEFTVLIEYVTSGKKGLESLLNNEFLIERGDYEIFEKFLKNAGNPEMIPLARKAFEKK